MSSASFSLKDIYRELSHQIPTALKNGWGINSERSYIDSSRSTGAVEFDWKSHRLTVRFAVSDNFEPIFDAAFDNEFPPKEFESLASLKDWVIEKEREIENMIKP